MLRETFIKRYIVERTIKAEMRPEEQSEKAESCRENLFQLTQEQNEKEWASSVGLCQRHNALHLLPCLQRLSWLVS